MKSISKNGTLRRVARGRSARVLANESHGKEERLVRFGVGLGLGCKDGGSFRLGDDFGGENFGFGGIGGGRHVRESRRVRRKVTGGVGKMLQRVSSRFCFFR